MKTVKCNRSAEYTIALQIPQTVKHENVKDVDDWFYLAENQYVKAIGSSMEEALDNCMIAWWQPKRN